MLVRDYMTPTPQTLQKQDSLKDAAFLFYKYRISGAPIVDEQNRLCGLLTQRHIVKAILSGFPYSHSIEDLMNQNVITATPDSTIEEAWKIPVSRLPIVENGKIVGIITRNDFLRIFHSQLLRSNDEVAALIRTARSGIITINAHGIIMSMNEIAAKVLETSCQDALGKDISFIAPAITLKEVVRTGQEELQQPFEHHQRILYTNNTPLREGSKIVGALAILQDLSGLEEIRKAYEKIKNAYEGLDSLIENSQHGMVVVNEENVIVRVNQAIEEIYGLSREQVLGFKASEVLENSKMDLVLRTGIPDFGSLHSVRNRQMVVNRQPLFKKGHLIGAMAEIIFQDLSQVQKLLAEVRRLDGTSHSDKPLEQSRLAHYSFENIIGRAKLMIKAKNTAFQASATDSNVLIIGESGTGKELFAHAIHSASPRKDFPFVCVNCAAIPDNLLESELFGYEDGAFTGAKKGGKKGKFEVAENGTIFLDEIGDMPLPMQAKLLRVLQEKTYERVGGNTVLYCNVRVIAATNKRLDQLVLTKRFREDLYYRLNVINIQVPPLRERREDIGELIHSLVPNICERLKIPVKDISPESMVLLRDYAWPGNVRELINVLEQLVVTTHTKVILPRHLLSLTSTGLGHSLQRVSGDSENAALSAMPEQERITEALRCAKGNKSLAASLLGLHRSTLYEKLKKYNIT